MPTEYYQRIVNLERTDYEIIQRIAREKGHGGKGFSAALRLIIREYVALRGQLLTAPPPDSISQN